jgi:mannitol-1-/sugar-/sorbitol-6-/2-deoxyglucose-6-phosphatase
MIQAAIFDMDGLLVDSEPHWRAVEIEVFRTVGLEMDDAMCKRTTGLPIDAVVRYWYERQPWENRTMAEVGEEITRTVVERIGLYAEAMPGTREILTLFQEQGIPMAVASASPMHLIELVLERLQIRSFFQLWHSATLEKRNKPHPDVYLGTARKLGVDPRWCLAFEDSGNGLKSAHAAGMLTVAVPADYEFTEEKFDIATLKIPSLKAFTGSTLQSIEQQQSTATL